MENEYYVISVYDDFRGRVTVARYNKDCRCFYDYHIKEYYDQEKASNFQVGQKITLNDNDFVISDDKINEEIIQVVEEKEKRKEELEKKHPDLFPQIQYQPTPYTSSIIEDYFKQLKSNGIHVDPYTVGIVNLLSSGMGLKVRRKHGGQMGDQIGFDYPEELQDVIGAMYDIISEFVEEHKYDKKSLTFALCDYQKKGKEYNDFTKEIERRTGYDHEKITSDLEIKQRSENYHGENFGFSEKYGILLKKKPTVYISAEETRYTPDRSEGSAGIEIITPDSCERKSRQGRSQIDH